VPGRPVWRDEDELQAVSVLVRRVPAAHRDVYVLADDRAWSDGGNAEPRDALSHAKVGRLTNVHTVADEELPEVPEYRRLRHAQANGVQRGSLPSPLHSRIVSRNEVDR
jgi:hypothetical protein